MRISSSFLWLWIAGCNRAATGLHISDVFLVWVFDFDVYCLFGVVVDFNWSIDYYRSTSAPGLRFCDRASLAAHFTVRF
jgi:hypothetical protein